MPPTECFAPQSKPVTPSGRRTHGRRPGQPSTIRDQSMHGASTPANQSVPSTPASPPTSSSRSSSTRLNRPCMAEPACWADRGLCRDRQLTPCAEWYGLAASPARRASVAEGLNPLRRVRGRGGDLAHRLAEADGFERREVLG